MIGDPEDGRLRLRRITFGSLRDSCLIKIIMIIMKESGRIEAATIMANTMAGISKGN